MNKILAIAFITLLTACPAKTKKVDDAHPVAVIDAAVKASIDAQPALPDVKDDRLKLVEKDGETAWQSQPIKLDDKIGFGIIAVVKRDNSPLAPPEITISFLGNHAEGRWNECRTIMPHLDGVPYELPIKPSYLSTENADLVTETMLTTLFMKDLAALAFAKELKVWLCEDIVLVKPGDQKLLQAMHSELRSPQPVE